MPADCSSSLTPTEQYRIEVKNETDIAGWREEARTLLVNNIPPEQLDWTVRSRANNSQFDFGVAEPPKLSTAAGTSDFRVAKECLRLINTALLHRNEDRFDLAYRLLFRMRHAPKIYQNPADSDGKRLSAYAKSVRRDIHKMHAFVRFRKTGLRENREQFIAWFEPDHHIVEAVGPFFCNRFTGMDWIIVTPEASLSWDGKSLVNGPGGCKQDVPTDDAVEQEWSTYYRNIFNPARLKTRAMKSEMPVKYWHNLPETALIPSLIKKSGAMVQQMMEKEEQQLVLGDEATVEHRTKPASLEALNAEMATHTRSISENSAVNAVFGEGPWDARIMLIGEQPGDQEDLAGRPFVGPAGQILDRALARAGISREAAYLTNAVKRFKYVQQGKRRIHQTPSLADIKHYRWWLEQECKLVKPDIIVVLGATAARAMTGKSVTISRTRGELLEYAEHSLLMITAHPSYILRIPDKAGQEIEYEKLVRDLSAAMNAVR